ncbi:Arabinose 5-phosphate isomerase [Croceitalea dokdonensis DOKDO 023]|uniref:Arabinose 5-phosphate isomerase n=1 Tax=Croceitalea dokdonensis DOKDO 023 TaxID=1300341 RepID=A0A0P7AIV0_9FLAO|nr:KpsF/GutQ family sugar-phosphate isomerase [Croceitalea dokdonensis]KPM31713.1 Arabinose 5-phosphate isomerase [Croceitalea dokdonensis DOKDO 023]
MNNRLSILDIAKNTIKNEGNAITNLAELLDENFENAVHCILKSKGRVVITGVGKSALIATKIVATFNSTGTPAIFMHAADAIHGDLGTILKDDVVICISKSGNTEEIKMLLPLIKRGNNTLIGLTGNLDSALAKRCDHVINVYVEKEACPNNLAPTTSTTAQLVMGDALAICLLQLKGFSSADFAKYHPGGSLGKKLYLRVSDIVENNQKPAVRSEAKVKEVIVEISEKMLGVTAVMEDDKVVGIVTDGDIRRMLNRHENIGGLTARDIMTSNPKFIHSDALAVKALDTMQDLGISQLLVIDGEDYRGVVHIHNLIKEGIL